MTPAQFLFVLVSAYAIFRHLSNPGVDFHTLREALEAWEPGWLSSTRQYEQSLLAYLKARFPKADIVKRYGWGNKGIDVHIEGLWGVELRRVKDKTTGCPRLVGHVVEYADDGEYALSDPRLDHLRLPRHNSLLRRAFLWQRAPHIHGAAVPTILPRGVVPA